MITRATLRDFALFCKGRGWVEEPPKGQYQVLFMRHTDAQKTGVKPLIVYERAKTRDGQVRNALTIFGPEPIQLAEDFIDSSLAPKEALRR